MSGTFHDDELKYSGWPAPKPPAPPAAEQIDIEEAITEVEGEAAKPKRKPRLKVVDAE